MNITYYQAKELYSLGFSFRHYTNNIHKGMVFYYKDSEWVIGGNENDNLSDEEKVIANNGIWLPSSLHLIDWLVDNDFVFIIKNTDGFFDIICKDSITETQYESKTPTLEVTLASIIKKILKKKERLFDTKEKVFGIIE